MDSEFGNKPPESETPNPARTWRWWAVFPLRLLLEIFVTLFDITLSRYLIAAIPVLMIWVPFKLAFNASISFLVWPIVVGGLALTGLWEGCHMYEIRPYFANWVLVPPESWEGKDS